MPKKITSVVLFGFLLVSAILPAESIAQTEERCPELEWSRWHPTFDGLHFSYRTCRRGSNREVEWNWANFSDRSSSIAFRIFTRDANNCTAPESRAIGSGNLSVAAGTRLDVPSGTSLGPGVYRGVHLCVSRDWRNAMQTAIQSLEVGALIRVSRASAPEEPLVGPVTSIGPNNFRILAQADDATGVDEEQMVTFDTISELAISRGAKNRAVFGLVAGGFLGVAGGAAVGAMTTDRRCEWVDMYDPELRRMVPARSCSGPMPGERAAIFGLVSGVAGSVLGYVIGSQIRVESWDNAGPTWVLIRF